MLQHRLLPAAVILGIAVLLVVALRSGQEWDGDFALYILNARNIVLGVPYDKTPYLFNAANVIHCAARRVQ